MQGGLRGEIEIPPDLPAKNETYSYKDLIYLQSIGKTMICNTFQQKRNVCFQGNRLKRLLSTNPYLSTEKLSPPREGKGDFDFPLMPSLDSPVTP